MKASILMALGLSAATALLAGTAIVAAQEQPQKMIGAVKPTGPVPSLFVVNSAGATLKDDKLTMTGVSANSIVFADRPVRAAGHVTTEQFIMQWDKDKDNFINDPPNATISVLDGDGSKVADAVVVLKAPKLEGGNLTFEVSVLEGSLAGSSGPAALFIDRGGGFGGGFGGGGRDFGGGDFGGRDFGGGGFDRFRGDYGRVGDTAIYHNDRTGNTYAWHGGNYWHAPVYHGAWYAGAPVGAGVVAGAAVGAAIAHPYWSDYYNNGYRCGYYPYPPCE